VFMLDYGANNSCPSSGSYVTEWGYTFGTLQHLF